MPRSSRLVVSLIVILLTGGASAGAAQRAESRAGSRPADPGRAAAVSPRVLLLTGQDDAHPWEENTSRLVDNLDRAGIRGIERRALTGDADWLAVSRDFGAFDVVALAYYTGDAPAAAITALGDYVRSGGGLVVVHSALAGLAGHAVFDEMIGLGWRGADYGSSLFLDDTGQPRRRGPGEGGGAKHPPLMDFEVRVREPEHSIMAGLPETWMQPDDELYYDLRGPADGIRVLATARTPAGENAPVLWTRHFGSGRVFVTALGHHAPAIDGPAFVTTLARGLEWTAGSPASGSAPRGLHSATTVTRLRAGITSSAPADRSPTNRRSSSGAAEVR